MAPSPNCIGQVQVTFCPTTLPLTGPNGPWPEFPDVLQVPDKAFPFWVKLHRVTELPSPVGAVAQLPVRLPAASAGAGKASSRAAGMCLIFMSSSYLFLWRRPLRIRRWGKHNG